MLHSVQLLSFLLHAFKGHMIHLFLLLTSYFIDQVQHTLLLQIFLLLDRQIVSGLDLQLLVKESLLDIGLTLHL